MYYTEDIQLFSSSRSVAVESGESVRKDALQLFKAAELFCSKSAQFISTLYSDDRKSSRSIGVATIWRYLHTLQSDDDPQEKFGSPLVLAELENLLIG